MATKRKRSAERTTSSAPPPPAPSPRRGWSPSLPLGRGAAILALVAVVAAAVYWLNHRGPGRPNLVVISIDTLRADHVGSYGSKRAQTPHLDALAARGVRFEHASAAIPLTGPSHATLFTGDYPPVHGVRDNVVFTLDDGKRTLAERLKDEGYRTGAFVGAYPVAAAFGFRQGFEEFRENFKESPIPGAGAQRPANEVADDAIPWLQKDDPRPFFAWLHLYDPHAPYDPPEPFRTSFAGHAYDGEIAFTDSQVGRVLESLKAAGHEADTVVVVVSDHGEALGEHGEQTHAVLIYESTLRVPFLLAGPGVPRGQVSTSRVGLVDVVPTVLGLLGVPAGGDLQGRDLRPAFRGERLRPEPLYAESLFGRLNCRWSSLRALTDGDYKLIEGSRTELFNLAEDPNEERNLATADTARAERMRAILRAAVGKMAPGGDRARTAAVAPEQEAMLRSLGYLAGSGGAGELDEPGLPDPRDRVHIYERLQVIQRPQTMSMDQALAEALVIQKEDPGNPFALQTVASLAYRMGRLGESARAYRRALELDPDRPSVRQSFGKLLRELGRLEESEKELRLALEQTDAEDIRTRASLVETLIVRGKTEEAGRLVEALLAKAPKDSEALRARGRWLIATGRVEEAAGVMQEASSGSDADALAELAEAWLARGAADKARAAAESALRVTPGQPWATGLLGHALILEGRRDEGLATLRRAVAGRPKRPRAWISLAEGFAAARDLASAEACRRAAQALATS